MGPRNLKEGGHLMKLKYVLIDHLGRGRVKRRRALILIIFLPLAGMCLACGVDRVPLEPAHLFHRERPIEVELTNYSFNPNHFVVLGDQSPVLLLLRNTDDVMHNFILMAPDRSILLSEDVKPKMTITVDTGFLNSGNYAFYCFFHQHRGMEGMLMVD